MEQKRRKHRNICKANQNPIYATVSGISNKTNEAKSSQEMWSGCRLAPGAGQVPTVRQPGSEKTNNLSGAALATSIKITHFIPFDPVIPVLGIHPRDTHKRVPRNTHSTFTPASFVTAVDWKQPNYTPCGDSLNNDTTSTGWNILR